MKVISGFLKGRNIEGFMIDGTRPTMDRVKESLFASIQNYIDNAVVLDLFSGSGNLGFEAISNGAKIVYFNDVNYEAIKIINRNIDKFNIKEKSVVLNMDYKRCLKYLKEKNIKYDIVFLDPPYNKKVLNDVIDFLINNDMLNKEAIVVCEINDNYLKENNSLETIKSKKYGDKFIRIFKVK